MIAAARWNVEILHPVTLKAKVWATYTDKQEAERHARQLRHHQIDARVTEAPEHNGERRKFMIWALMIGATSPAVVAERILAEAEAQ